MKRTFFLVLLLAIVALLLSGCSDSGTGDGHDTGREETILQLAYSHAGDSDGGKVAEGAILRLFFEPDGRINLYAADEEHALVYQGAYHYDNGTLNLKFDEDNFGIDVGFSLKLSDQETTMPFQVFSGAEGSSTWTRQPMSIVEGLHFIFRSAVLAEDGADSLLDGRDRALAWAEAVLDSTNSSASSSGKRGVVHAATYYIPGQYHIEDVFPIENGIKVRYWPGAPIEEINVILWSWLNEPDTSPLQQSPISRDPRVHLQAYPLSEGAADPVNMTALFITPFQTQRTLGYSASIGLRFIPPVRIHPETHLTASDNFNYNEMGNMLRQKGYNVAHLTTDEASVLNIIEAFRAGEAAPGFIVFNSHGSADGAICTGERVGENFENEVTNNYYTLIETLAQAGYPDMQRHLTLMNISRAYTDRGDYFVALRPSFWEWLRESQRVDFGSSLFYSANCLTAESAELREAILARSFFGWTISVHPHLAGAVFQYLVTHLSRPGHSAEEAYYNIIRIDNTRQMIFQEDLIFNQVLPSVHVIEGAIEDIWLITTLQAYGYDGTALIPYNENGWFDRNLNQGQIWWMLFAGRWGQCADTGAENLMQSWENFWSQGNFGRLKGPFANAANIGVLPTQDEVVYAIYLLSGRTEIMPVPRPQIPRWTLNDQLGPIQFD